MHRIKLALPLLMALVFIGTLSAQAGPGPGPGPSGSGPPDPPRDTPGLDPVTLAAMASGGYFGYQYLKFKKGSKSDADSN